MDGISNRIPLNRYSEFSSERLGVAFQVKIVTKREQENESVCI